MNILILSEVVVQGLQISTVGTHSLAGGFWLNDQALSLWCFSHGALIAVPQ